LRLPIADIAAFSLASCHEWLRAEHKAMLVTECPESDREFD
jgi:hypothetical protein